jgi:hypothetical protein
VTPAEPLAQVEAAVPVPSSMSAHLSLDTRLGRLEVRLDRGRVLAVLSRT